MNRAPHAFGPVKSRWSNILKRWLRGDNVKRSTIFLLGFGLNMTDQEVSMFLTKVLKEQDFQFEDPSETIYWHCFHCGLPYSRAVSLLKEYENIDAPGNPEFWEKVRGSLPVYLSNPEKLREYLCYLKSCRVDPQETVFREFQILYERAVNVARTVLHPGKESAERDNSHIGASGFESVHAGSSGIESVHAGSSGIESVHVGGSEIESVHAGGSEIENLPTGASDIENVLCNGIPKTGAKNLSPASKSMLRRQFAKKRMSRQHIGRLLRREAPVERFDLISLLFLVYAVAVEPEWPYERYIRFIDEINDLLKRCRMMELYPVNPYESFVLMCLLTETPLTTYNDVWEMSYGGIRDREPEDECTDDEG